MKKYIFIGAGGVMGAVLRFAVKNADLYPQKIAIPIQTLIVNLVGSFLLALLLCLAIKTWTINKDLKLGITVGFLGAFTTFSTLCKEIVTFMHQGFFLSAVSYMAVSVMLGLSAVYLGAALAKAINLRSEKQGDAPEKNGGTEELEGDVN